MSKYFGIFNKQGCHTRGDHYSKLTRFRRDEEGSLIIFSLFLLILILMISGMAVDLMRSETQRARLQSTLDRAVLAGASLEQTLNSEAVVLDYFDKAGLGEFISADDINVTESATSKTVSASAAMSVNTYFMKMLGITSLSVPAAGEAEESVTDIEISLVVDVSGSMGWNSTASGNPKMDDLQDAAKEFVYLMQCDPDAETPFDGNCIVEPNTISISLIPYNQQVALGEDLLQQYDVTNEHAISSCMDVTTAAFSVMPVPLAPLVPGLVPPTLLRTASMDTFSGWYGPTPRGRAALDNWRECRPDSLREIMVYENDYQQLETAIDLLTAGGNTSIDLGMKWGAALLDPSFRPALSNLSNAGFVEPDFIGRPFDYDRVRTKKVVVLMTDGVNTTQYKVVPALREGMSPYYVDPNNGNVSIYNADENEYFYLDDGGTWEPGPDGGGSAVRLSYPDFWERYNLKFYFDTRNRFDGIYPVTAVRNDDKNANLDAMCTAAKNEGVLIFTIGFETSAESSAVMASCASGEPGQKFHFDVDGTDISVAFNSIARTINQLRLTN